jgi:hypothetical protein
VNVRIPTRRSRRTLAVIVALVAVPLAMQAPGGAAASRKAVVHGVNHKSARGHYSPSAKMFRLGHGAGEPTLGIDRKGDVFITVSSGCVTSCTGSDEMLQTVAPGGRAVYATFDHGKTWKDVTPGAQGVSPHVISMDPYMYVDQTPDGNRIFDVDLTVACAELSYSDNGGQSWTTNPAACGEPVNDHQTVFTGKPVKSTTLLYPNIVYYCFNHPAFTKCSKSIDGGLNFIPTAQINNPRCSGLNGHGVTNAKGVIFLPLGSCGKPNIAISGDEGDSWNVVQVNDDLGATGDPSVAVDKNGTLYYLWVDSDDRLPWLSISKTSGKTWSKPVMVAPKGVGAVNLATLDVGAPGKVAIAYYGTSDATDPDAGWNGYIASGVDVLTSHPTFYTASINSPGNPLKIKGCGPGRCGRVLDFIDVEIAPDGSPWGAYVDACLATCEKTRQESIHDNEGIVGTLVGGPKLR